MSDKLINTNTKYKYNIIPHSCKSKMSFDRQVFSIRKVILLTKSVKRTSGILSCLNNSFYAIEPSWSKQHFSAI